MCANEKSEAYSDTRQCEWVAANQLSGVQPGRGAADLSLDLANRVPQFLSFSFEFLLEFTNIFVCAHKTPSPITVRFGQIPTAEFCGSACGERRSIARSRGAECYRPGGIL
jgi:hypothetical protein